jgi:DNA excision repair protein ERCC-8
LEFDLFSIKAQFFFNFLKRSDGRISLWDIRASKSCLMDFDCEKSVELNKNKSSKKSYSNKIVVAHYAPVIGLTFTNDGNHILSLGKDNQMRLWNSRTGLNTLVNYGKIPIHHSSSDTYHCLQISCTEDCLNNYTLIPSGSNLRMYNIFDGTLKKTWRGHYESVNCSIYNPILNEIYTGSKDRNILIWTPDNYDAIINSKKRKSSFNNNPFNKKPSNIYSIFSTDYQNSNQAQLDNWSDDET